MPIRLERAGDIVVLPVPIETPGPDSREAYSITITQGGVLISGHSSVAVYHGVQTLFQMVKPDQGRQWLPIATVRDCPALSYRGTLMDTGSEGPMLTTEDVIHQIDFIARWKANQYLFYSEVY